jgi:hypothetical protein
MNKVEKPAVAAPIELIEFAHQRSVAVVSKLQKAMKAIEADVEGNAGLYPFNGGRISQSEVCRRAGVSKVTLQGKGHKSTTKVLVDEWVKRVCAGVVSGKKSVRKTVTARADAWKESHRQIAQAYHLDQKKYELAKKKILELEAELATLRQQFSEIAKGNVLALPRREP